MSMNASNNTPAPIEADGPIPPPPPKAAWVMMALPFPVQCTFCEADIPAYEGYWYVSDGRRKSWRSHEECWETAVLAPYRRQHGEEETR